MSAHEENDLRLCGTSNRWNDCASEHTYPADSSTASNSSTTPHASACYYRMRMLGQSPDASLSGLQSNPSFPLRVHDLVGPNTKAFQHVWTEGHADGDIGSVTTPRDQYTSNAWCVV